MTLSQDACFVDTTVLVVSATVPQRGSDLLELGALVLRYAGFRYIPVDGGVYCVPDPAAGLETTMARSGLHPELLRGRPPAAIALAYLDAHLVRPPYLVATHGPVLGEKIAAHRDCCPALAELTILDTARLARHAFPGADPRLEAWAARLDTRGLSERVDERTRLTTALFMHAMREVLRRGDLADLASLTRVAKFDQPARSTPRPTRGPADPAREGRLAWTPARA